MNGVGGGGWGYLMAKTARAYIYRSLDEELLREAMPSSPHSPPVLSPFHSMYLHVSTVYTIQHAVCHTMNVMLYQLVGYVSDCGPSMSRWSEQVVPNVAVKSPIGISANHFWSDHTCVVACHSTMLHVGC